MIKILLTASVTSVLILLALSGVVPIGLQEFSDVENAGTFAQPNIEFYDSGVVKWTSGTPAESETVPPGMEVTKVVRVISRCSQTLSNITVTTSCGCTEARMTKAILVPGEESELSYTFTPSDTSNEKTVNIFVNSDGANLHRLQMRFKTDASLANRIATSFPPVIALNEPWSADFTRIYKVRICTGDDLEIDDLSFFTSANHLGTEIEEVHSDHEFTLRVFVNQPNPGLINEWVAIKTSNSNDYLRLKIPVVGRIQERFLVSPSVVNLGTVSIADVDAAADVIVETSPDTDIESVKLKVEGDWILSEAFTIAPGRSRVRVSLSKTHKPGHCFGRLLIGGELGEAPMAIALMATSER